MLKFKFGGPQPRGHVTSTAPVLDFSGKLKGGSVGAVVAVVGRYSTAALRGACALEAGTPRAAPADGGPRSLCRAGLGAGCGRLALGFWSWPFSSWFG